MISVGGTTDASGWIPGGTNGGGAGGGNSGAGYIGANKAGARCIPGANPGSGCSWASVKHCARVSGGVGAAFDIARCLSESLEIPEPLESCDLDRDDLSDAVFRGILGGPIFVRGGGLGGGLIVGV